MAHRGTPHGRIKSGKVVEYTRRDQSVVYLTFGREEENGGEASRAGERGGWKPEGSGEVKRNPVQCCEVYI